LRWWFVAWQPECEKELKQKSRKNRNKTGMKMNEKNEDEENR
jgi:hypothetical protein